MTEKNIKVIFDTNVWISFLIGKRLHIIQDYILDGSITIVITEQLLTEIKEVALRPKLKKYFPQNKVTELIEFLEIIGLKKEIRSSVNLCKDPKDNFLLDLIESSNAHVLVTGDKELIKLNPFKTAQIITPKQFEQFLIS
jgi:hypothetical protein